MSDSWHEARPASSRDLQTDPGPLSISALRLFVRDASSKVEQNHQGGPVEFQGPSKPQPYTTISRV
jgi:hypothetical protein